MYDYIMESWYSRRKKYRQQLAERLNYTCCCCRNTFKFNDLVIHHIVPHKRNLDLLHDMSNMYLVCANCHTLIHKHLSHFDTSNRNECLLAITEAIEEQQLTENEEKRSI